MSEEEMKAVDYWKNYMEILHWNTQLASEHYMKVLLDLIEKQQIELNSLKEIEYKYNKALEDLVKLEKERQADKEKIKELEKENQSKQEQINSKLLKGWELIGKVVEAREQTHKEYIEVIEKNPTKAFILKCKLEAYEDLLKDGGE